MFQRAGYRVKILNTINFSKSMKYNPFVYIHSEKDVLKLVNTLIANTKGEGEKSAEDFWVKSERLFYTALIGYIWYEAPAEEMNFTSLLEMINASEAREDDPDFQSPVDLMFERLEQKDPDHFAVRQYKKFLLSTGKTRSSILISCGARLRCHSDSAGNHRSGHQPASESGGRKCHPAVRRDQFYGKSIVPADADGVIPYPFFLSNLEAEVKRVQESLKATDEPEDVSPLCGMKFLCAEDNDINAEILEMLLESKGASCKICKNGQEIVDAFASVKPGDYDMILMDVQMPVMNGLDVTRAIRSGSNPLGRTIPILAMTANAFFEDMQQSRGAGMDEHLSKPVDMAVLEQTVRRFRSTPETESNGGARFAR